MGQRSTIRAGAPRVRRLLLALTLYLGATLVYFAGALPAMGGGFPGGPVAAIDGWQQVWHLWWVERAIGEGRNPFQMDLIYHPGGVNLAIHPLTLATGLSVAPATALAGPVVAYNLALLLSFTLTGLAGYLLALRAGARPAAALVAGLLLTFTPFHATKAYDGQLEFVAMHWLAIYAWLLLVAAEERGLVAPALAGAALAVVGYTSLYYLIYGAIYSLLFVLLWCPWRRPEGAVRYLARSALIPALAMLLLMPLLLNLRPALGEVTGGGALGGTDPRDLASRSANLLDFLLPSNLHPVWGPAVARLGQPWHPGIAAWNHALGYSAVALAAVACAAAWGRAWRWLALAGAGLVLALGPTLIVGAADTGLPLPYRLLLLVPGMGVARRPGHTMVITLLALTPLAGLGLSWLVERYGRAALVAALALAAIELAPPPWPIQPFAVHQVYSSLAARPGALMVLPVAIDSSATLRDQLVHGRPLVGGFLARTPPYPFAEQTPGVRQLWRLAPDEAALADPAGATPAEALAAYGIGEVVVRWDQLGPEGRAAAEAALAQVLPGVAPGYDDGALAVYSVPPATPGPFVFFGAGWYAEERDGPRRWRWMRERGELVLMNPHAEPAPVTLRLRAESYGEARTAALALNGAPAGSWAVGGQPAAATLSMRLLLPPGESRLTIKAPTSPDAAGRGPISLVVSEVQIE